ncbi:unnamed protein product [Anisakis simplex]|uniref:Secreted protein n=1 Tax=Anisakis simplex TaxID=6269 RepID=A0A0M3KI12_ANISI|nr:unnamed protein product [Anisakis simplex]
MRWASFVLTIVALLVGAVFSHQPQQFPGQNAHQPPEVHHQQPPPAHPNQPPVQQTQQFGGQQAQNAEYAFIIRCFWLF